MAAEDRYGVGRFRRAGDLVAAVLGVALVTLIGRWGGANPATAGFLFLLIVLGLSVWRGVMAGLVTSLIGTLCYNFFFLRPYGTFTVADPANWVALITFLITSVVASRLVVRAQQKAEDAQRSAREAQTLYDLGFGIFTTMGRLGAVGDATAACLRTLGARSGGLVLFPKDSGTPLVVSAIGSRTIDPGHPMLAAVLERREMQVTDVDGEKTSFIPLQVGERMIGVLIAGGTEADERALESAGRLMGLAVERERLLAETTHLEALKASDALKTSLLRAVSHDLRTPLTAMRLQMESLHRRLQDRSDLAPLLASLARERERITRRIDDLLTLARLESGIIEPHPEPTPATALFASAREHLSAILSDRAIEVRVDPEGPDLYVDPSLALEALVNLLENAARAAPADLPLELSSMADPEDPGAVRVEVLDRGPGTSPTVRQVLLGPQPPGPVGGLADAPSGGLGLEIVAGLAAALGGRFALLPRPGGGSIARLVLPAAGMPNGGPTVP